MALTVGSLAVASVLAALATAHALAPRRAARVRPLALARLAGWFVVAAVRGGADVARRALGPRRLVQPGWLRYRTELADGLPPTVFAAAVGLLPGTVTARIEGDELDVHVLATDLDARATLAALERRVAAALEG